MNSWRRARWRGGQVGWDVNECTGSLQIGVRVWLPSSVIWRAVPKISTATSMPRCLFPKHGRGRKRKWCLRGMDKRSRRVFPALGHHRTTALQCYRKYFVKSRLVTRKAEAANQPAIEVPEVYDNVSEMTRCHWQERAFRSQLSSIRGKDMILDYKSEVNPSI